MTWSRREALLALLSLGGLGALGATGCAPSARGASSLPTSTGGPGPLPPRTAPKKVLILGGTKFLGPEIVESALARGHTLTLFNRGKTNPQLFPNVEKLHGDRQTGDLASLRGRKWDVVIDTSGYFPREVTQAASILADAGQYIFISTISVYDKPPARGVDESGAVAKLADETIEEVGPTTYGALKALCERAAERAMPGRVTVLRPGLIVGPTDPTDRFTYWPVRVDEGGEVLAPGAPSDPVQLIDVRDLGSFVVTCLEQAHMGVMNAVGPKNELGIGELLAQAKAVTGSKATLTWVDAAFLEAQKVSPWSDMPLWIPPSDEDAGSTRVSSARAIARGLTFRPVADTIRDTLAWWKKEPPDRRAKMKAGITREREREVLAAFHARSASAPRATSAK